MLVEINQNLKRLGSRMWLKRSTRCVSIALTLASVYWICYLGLVILIGRMSLTLNGLVMIPAIIFLLTLGWSIWDRIRLSRTRTIARDLEDANPDIDLKIRTALDLIERRTDTDSGALAAEYIDMVSSHLSNLPAPHVSIGRWASAAVVASLVAASLWLGWGDLLRRKFEQPTISFSNTQLVFEDGSMTIFEPEYTNIPGRTLALRPETYQAYPGSRIRLTIHDARSKHALFVRVNDQEDLQEIRSESPGTFSHEFLLLEPTRLEFFVDDSQRGGRTQPYLFETKTDHEPQIELKSHTPEGSINALDPLYLDAIIKDDFGVSKLEAIIAWGNEEKRMPLQVPNNQRTHFVSKNRWSLSDLVPQETESFSVTIEAVDNNPINGPGIGLSETLHFELESPERKHDELMALARELLDKMANVLGDNLDTSMTSVNDAGAVNAARGLSENIQTGLFHAQGLAGTMMSLIRDDPFATSLDYEFLREFNNGVTRVFRERVEMAQLFASIARNYRPDRTFQTLGRMHGREEVRVEQLTYDLLLQLKMWALMNMERNREQLQQSLEDLEKLLADAESMEQEQLEEAVEQMLNEIMKEMQQMMARAAQEMDQTLSEFMNQEGMEFQQDQLEKLKKEMMEALRNGDKERLKQLMEQFRQMMEASMSGMQQAMGEMSPEMQQMMQDMREMMGLLKELKEQEETLKGNTQAFKNEMDQEMGGNGAQFNQEQRKSHLDAMQRIKQLLSGLHERLVDFQHEDTSKRLMRQIADLSAELEHGDLSAEERHQLERRVDNAERTLDFIMRDALDTLQDVTLKSLDDTERMSDLLSQGELMQSLDAGFKLENRLLQGERLSERGVTQNIQEEARPKETFAQAREELYKVMEALQNLKQNMEQRRQEHMAKSGQERQSELEQRQQEIRDMISEFQERVDDSLGGSQMMDKLDQIGLSMKNAERKLGDAKLDGGLYYEQEALRQIGEVMEQMQQSMRPGQMQPQMRYGRGSDSMHGNPDGDVYIPESQHALQDDKLKDEIRRQLQKNFPDRFGKEIKEYYETLIDQ